MCAMFLPHALTVWSVFNVALGSGQGHHNLGNRCRCAVECFRRMTSIGTFRSRLTAMVHTRAALPLPPQYY